MHRKEANLGLRKPCANCPFLKEGAINLRAGRLEGIIDGIASDDWSTFVCHKTIDRSTRQTDEDGDERCTVTETTHQCAGATIYLLKLGRWNLRMRLARAFGGFDPGQYTPHFDSVIDPVASKIDDDAGPIPAKNACTPKTD